jgi:hypothetical protein
MIGVNFHHSLQLVYWNCMKLNFNKKAMCIKKSPDYEQDTFFKRLI